MKVSDKLKKVSESINIIMYDNGYVIEVQGRDLNDNYTTAKIMCHTVDQLLELVKEAATAPRDQ